LATHISENPMRALVKKKPEPGLWLEEQPIPEIGPNDVLVNVHKTGICGTDIHIFNWDEWAQKTIPTPMTVGHEYSGEIAVLGANVRHFKVGQRVSGEGHVIGMKSRAARGGRYHLDPDTRGIGVNIPGAFAEYVRVPAFNIVPLPDDVDRHHGRRRRAAHRRQACRHHRYQPEAPQARGRGR
jgi:threonine 3-dehydrogenase